VEQREVFYVITLKNGYKLFSVHVLVYQKWISYRFSRVIQIVCNVFWIEKMPLK